MSMPSNRSQLLPWYIGLAIIMAAVIYEGYALQTAKCEATGLALFLVLFVVPTVYLALMYLTLRSQR